MSSQRRSCNNVDPWVVVRRGTGVPRWLPQRAQCTSMRTMKKLRSVDVPTASSSGSQKLGHPVRLSYFVAEENRGWSQAAQANVPARFSSSRGLLKARSVPWPPKHPILFRRQRRAPGLVCLLDRKAVLDYRRRFDRLRAPEPGKDRHQAQAGPGDGRRTAAGSAPL